jgi:hypothetical protein
MVLMSLVKMNVMWRPLQSMGSLKMEPMIIRSDRVKPMKKRWTVPAAFATRFVSRHSRDRQVALLIRALSQLQNQSRHRRDHQVALSQLRMQIRHRRGRYVTILIRTLSQLRIQSRHRRGRQVALLIRALSFRMLSQLQIQSDFQLPL